MQAEFDRDINFLIACCRADVSDDVRTSIREFILHHLSQSATEEEGSRNLWRIIELAHQHGVYPLVYHALSSVAPDLFSDSAKGDLRRANLRIVQNNMRLVAELIRISRLFEQSRIPFLVLKGPVLAQLAFENISLRQYGDLDILVNDRDALRAGELLIATGYESLQPLKLLRQGIYLDVSKDMGFLSEDKCLHVELHWRMAEQRFPQLPVRIGNARLPSVEIHGVSIPTLANEELLVYLCLHGFMHSWERVEWVCDLDRLIRRQEIEWEKTLDLARECRALQPLLVGTSLSRNLFGTPLPDQVLEYHLAPDIEEIVEKSVPLLCQGYRTLDNRERKAQLLKYQALMFHDKLSRLRFYLNTLFRISPSDCHHLLLPRELKYLYPVLRPWRLVVNYAKPQAAVRT